VIDKIKKYIRFLEKDAIPQLSINCVIFGFHEKKLKVIVNNVDLGPVNILVLPGGYIGQAEDLTDAVERIVRESTGLEKIMCKQFEVFGNASRSFGEEFPSIKKTLSDPDRQIIKWVSKRFVTICYLALVDFDKIDLKPTRFLEAAQWLPVDEAMSLAMDHGSIVSSARESLMKELPHSPIASNLLPSKFTLPELQALIEAILGRSIDRPNFRRKVLKSDMLMKVGQDTTNKRRPADLYRFRYGKKTSLTDEYKFGF
jgi:ADP-ribose pyrophosphatase YjhB (NUDIX family)